MAQLLIQGRLLLHSETGTEGGYWAIQDSAWTHRWDADPRPAWCTRYGSCPCDEREHQDATGGYSSEGTGKRLTDTHSSYEGLHTLQDGDWLRVIDEWEGHVLWEGTVKLVQQNPYAATSASAGGLAIHSFPDGVNFADWQDWFFGECRAVLTRTVKT